MEKIIADFVARASFHDKAGEKRMEEFEKSRIILSDRHLLIVFRDEKVVIHLKKIFDVRKIDIPDDIKDLMEDSLKIAFTKDGKPEIVVIKGDGSKMDKFSYLLMKLLLKGNKVIYKHPAMKGGVLLKKDWKSGLLNVAKGTILLDGIAVKLSSVRDIRVESRSIGNLKADVLNIKMVVSGESLTSYLYVPDRRVMNLLGRYIGFEYGSMLKKLEKIKLSSLEKQIVQAVYSGIPVDELPLLLNIEASEAQRVVNDLESKGLLKGGFLTPIGEIAASRYVEDINV